VYLPEFLQEKFMTWLLCSKEDVISVHPCKPEELPDFWSDAVEGLIRQYMGQPNLGIPQAVVDEYYDGDGSNILHVKSTPIVSVESLSVDGFVLMSGDYEFFDSYVELRYMTFSKGNPLNVKISYTSGTVGSDSVVRLAAVAMIAALLNYRKRYGSDSSIKWGTTNEKAGEESPNLNVGLTSHLVSIMKRILRRPTVRVR
jgi:hypothetical protein